MNPFITRRDAIGYTVGAVACAGVLSGSTEAADDKPDAGYVDCHSHVWTTDVEKFPLAKGVTKNDLDPPSFTDDELLKVARPEGVRRVVLISHTKYHGFDNSYLVHAAAKRPGTFSIVAGVDDRAPHPEVTMRRLAKQHTRGFRITSWRDPKGWLDSPGMAAMWKCGAEDGLAMCTLIDPPAIGQVDAMCRRFADTPVVVDHFARIGVDGTIRDADVARLCRLARHKHAYVKVSAFYALGKKKPPYLDLVGMIRRVLDAFGPRRLMWGSDCPYQLGEGHTYRDSIALVRERLDFLSAGDRQWLLGKTAAKVYFT